MEGLSCFDPSALPGAHFFQPVQDPDRNSELILRHTAKTRQKIIGRNAQRKLGAPVQIQRPARRDCQRQSIVEESQVGWGELGAAWSGADSRVKYSVRPPDESMKSERGVFILGAAIRSATHEQ